MSYDLTVSLPNTEAWTDAAVIDLIGQHPRVQGHSGEVTAAWRDHTGTVCIRLHVEGDPLPCAWDDEDTGRC